MGWCVNGCDNNLSCVCEYHLWLNDPARRDAIDLPSCYTGLCQTIKLPELSRLNYLDAIDPYNINTTKKKEDELEKEKPVKYRCLEDEWFLHKKLPVNPKASAKKTVTTSVGMSRLVKFQKLLKYCNSAPWANIVFNINEEMISRLVASHLSLIVGKEYWEAEKGSLYPIINPTEDLSNTQNIAWITNRQQGKTSTLAKFLAVLSVLSPAGGNLMCVYSTSLDRAQELTRAAKKYIYWLGSDDGAKDFLLNIDIDPPQLTQDNERAYTVMSQYGVRNTVLSRPKNPDSCRGDAPKAAILDEIGTINLI